jgi:hypothetical protein
MKLLYQGKVIHARPIHFNVEMRRANWEGRKNQTRRVVHPQPEEVGFGHNAIVREYCTGKPWPLAYYEMRASCWNSSSGLVCPYGRKGDFLWMHEPVKITDCIGAMRAGGRDQMVDFKEDNLWQYMRPDSEGLCGHWAIGRFRGGKLLRAKEGDFAGRTIPFEFARAWLQITEIRVQRVQEITPADCRAEGQPKDNNDVGVRYGYGALWNQINEPRGFGWDRNPHVWAISYRFFTIRAGEIK